MENTIKVERAILNLTKNELAQKIGVSDKLSTQLKPKDTYHQQLRFKSYHRCLASFSIWFSH